MSGLLKILKLYGRMKIEGEEWVYDYANHRAVKASEMPLGSDAHKASERAKWMGGK